MSTFRRSSRQVKAGSRRRANQRIASRRRAGCEQLEARQMLAADVGHWQNPYIPTDVNDDGWTTTMDALVVLNAINAYGQGQLDSILASSARGEGSFSAFYDVNGDDYLTGMDFNQIATAVNEGEGNDTMTYTLRTFNEAGSQEISNIGVGQKFQLRAFVRDNRVLGNFPNGNPREGVFAAYLDVEYTAASADVSGTIQHNNNDYGQAPSGNTATDGIIDGAGSFRGSLTPIGRNEFLLWSLPMTATAQGAITFTGEPTTEPADPGDQGQSPSLDTGVYGEDRPICPSVATCTGTMGFVNATLNVVTDISAGNDNLTVLENSGPTTPSPSVLANDSVLNPPGGTPVITAVTQGNQGGTVTFNTTNVTYQPAAGFSGTELFTYTISNGQGATAVGTVTVSVTGVNSAPVVTVPGPQTSAEDAVIAFNAANNRAISFADADGDITAQGTLTANNGRLSVPSTAGVTITGNNTGNLQLTGVISAINTALTGLTYTPNLNFNGSDTLTAAVNDQGNTGGGALTDSETVALTISAVNDAPVNTVPGDTTTEEEEAVIFSTTNGNALAVADVDAGSSPLAVRLSVDQGGTINLASTAGVTVTNNGTAAVDITGPATAITTALGSGVTFTPAAGFVGSLTFTMRSNDQGATGSGGAQVDTDTFSIDVDTGVRPRAVNDTVTVAEDTAAGIAINVLQNDRPHEGTSALLKSFTQPVTGGIVTRIDNGTATLADDQLRFVANANFAGVASFTYTINDTNETLPAGDPNRGVDSTATVNVTVSAVNDAPVNTVPGAQTTTEDTARVINGISVADIDAGTSNIEVTLSVTNGRINVTAAGTTVANNGTSSVKVTGALAAVNAALGGGVTYTPNQNFNGSDTLTVATSDLGSTGTPGALTDTDTVAITITAVNDAPVNTVPGLQVATKDQDFVLSSAAQNAIQIADVDAGNNNVQVALSTQNGTLIVGNTAGVTITGNSSGSVTLTGPVTSINSALGAGVTYRPTNGFSGNATVTVTTSDLGNTGGAAQTDVDTITIKVEDFRPSTIGGGVFVDANGNGVRESTELGLQGVVITLEGTDILGAAVNLETVTDANGRFSFPALKPGTYTLEETQPAGLRDGSDLIGTGLSGAGNDRATITIVRPGGISSENTLFAEMGLEATFIRAGSDLLASSARPDQASGVVFGTDGLSSWTVFRGDGWSDYDSAAFTIISQSSDNRYAVVTLTARHKSSNTTRSVTLDSSVDSRCIFIQDGSTTVIRFTGRPDDLFARANGEGEAGMSGADYSQAVDEVMAQVATAMA